MDEFKNSPEELNESIEENNSLPIRFINKINFRAKMEIYKLYNSNFYEK